MPQDATSKPQAPEVHSSEPTVSSAINKLSERKPEVVSEITAMMMGSMVNPLHQKMNEEHISKVLDLAAKHDERQYELVKGQQALKASNRWFNLIVFLVVIAVLVILILAFKDRKEVLIPLVTAIVSFGGGFGSGWGVAKKSSASE